MLPNHCAIMIVGIMFLLNNIEFGIVVQEEMQFNDISYLEFKGPLCSAELNHLCSF